MLIEGWARDGLREEDIAHNMGIAYSTLRDWKKKYPAILAAIKKGKEVVDYAVESSLLKESLNGNVTAMIFWLKNRRPDKWRDRPETQKSNETVLIIDDIKEGDQDE